MRTIDVRGLSCPQPLIMVKNAISENKESFEVLIDEEVTKENVLRTLKQFKLIAKIIENSEYTICKVER